MPIRRRRAGDRSLGLLASCTLLGLLAGQCRKDTPELAFQEFRPEPEGGKLTQPWTGIVISNVAGRALVRRAGTNQWVPVVSGMVMNIEDELKAEEGAKMLVNYDDGTRVEVKPGTVLIFRESRTDESGDQKVAALFIRSGEVLTRVQGLGANSKVSLRILTPNGLVRVASTGKTENEVVVSMGAGSIVRVSTHMGSAQIISALGTSLDVGEQQTAQVSAAGVIETVSQAPPPEKKKPLPKSKEAEEPELGSPAVEGPDEQRVNVKKGLVTLRWKAQQSAREYVLEASPDASFSRVILNERVRGTSFDLEYENEPTIYWRVRAVDKQGGSSPFTQTHRVQFVGADRRMEGRFFGTRAQSGAPQRLDVLTPEDNAVVTTTSVKVSGRAEPGSAVLVNNKAASVRADGSFSVVIELKEGLNQIAVESRGQNGKTAHKTHNVFCKPR